MSTKCAIGESCESFWWNLLHTGIKHFENIQRTTFCHNLLSCGCISPISQRVQDGVWDRDNN